MDNENLDKKDFQYLLNVFRWHAKTIQKLPSNVIYLTVLFLSIGRSAVSSIEKLQ